jgi:hypothetical protein
VGLVLGALTCSPAAAAPAAGVLQRALLGHGDRFIAAPSGGGAGFVSNAGTKTMAFGASGIEVRPRVANGSTAKSSAAAVLRYEFASAATVAPVGLHDSGITYNWFVGERRNWAANLKSYSQVAYADLWPGVSATYSGDASGFKYHFDVAPGADAKAIRFVVRGASDARIAADGAVEWTVGGASVRDEAPVAYQSGGGADRIVAASFRLEPIDATTWSLAIDVAGHDATRRSRWIRHGAPSRAWSAAMPRTRCMRSRATPRATPTPAASPRR